MFILCSPHNPVGRVWTRDELICMGDICVKNNVLVVSDEIHADFVYKGFRHLVFSDLKQEYKDITLTCTAPSKTFNLAGLQIANIFITNKRIKDMFRAEINAGGYSQLNTLGLVACSAAYRHGADWLDQLIPYLAGNVSFVKNFLSSNLTYVKFIEPQGTYLVWLDFSTLGICESDRKDFLTHKANIWLDEGTMFGIEGKGFERINLACPRSTLEKAFFQLEKAIKQ